MISAVGVRNLVETNTDFSKSRNVLVAALIMVLSIGISYSNAGAINIPVGGMTLSLPGLATGSLVGIILNAILPGKDYTFEDDKPNRTGVNFEIISGETILESREKSKKK
jgi:uracil permease